jgi:hypothetical protein
MHRFPAKATVSNATPKLDESSQGSQLKEIVKSTSPKLIKKKLKRRVSGNVSSHSAYAEMFHFPWDVSALELKVNQSLPWPVGSFSLAFWLYVDSGRHHVERDYHARATRGKYGKQKPHGKDMTKDDVDNIVHVISFGTKTAWFEVWVNFVRATLICRYSRVERLYQGAYILYECPGLYRQQHITVCGLMSTSQ